MDKSDNLIYCFWLCCYIRSGFIPRNCSFKSLLYISWKFDIIINRQSDRHVVSVGLAPPTSGALDMSDITHYFDHVKSSSISQIIKSKTRDLQKLLKCFNGTTTSAFNLLLLFDMLRIIFVLYSKALLVVVCCCFLYNYLHHYFH